MNNRLSFFRNAYAGIPSEIYRLVNSVAGNNSGNSRNGYGKKTIISDYGECEIAVPRDRNGEFEPKLIEKRQTRTDEIEQKIMQIRTPAEQSSARNIAVRHRRCVKANLWSRDYSGTCFENNRQDSDGGQQMAEPSA